MEGLIFVVELDTRPELKVNFIMSPPDPKEPTDPRDPREPLQMEDTFDYESHIEEWWEDDPNFIPWNPPAVVYYTTWQRCRWATAKDEGYISD